MDENGEATAWVASFTSLPKYQTGTTTEIVYTVKETGTYAGYTADPTDAVASGGTITNTQETTEADATKAWKNADGTTTAPEGAKVTFTLYADGTATDKTVELDGTAEDTAPTVTGGYESEAWKASFVNLPKYQADGTTEIEYTIKETTTYAGYTADPTDAVASGGTITNTQETTEADATKAWKNADGTTTAPEGAKVTFTLYADGTATDKTVELDGTAEDTAPTVTGGYESEAWTAKFVNLPKYQTGTTTEIVYTVAESVIYPGYTASTTDPVADGETITNTQETTTVTVSKVWKDGNNKDKIRPASVKLTLYADGVATEKTVTLSEKNAWTDVFESLPKYQADGTTPIEYSVKESEIPVPAGFKTGYSAKYTIEQDTADGSFYITVTNTHKPRIINTGDEAFNTAPYLAGMGVSGLLFLALALNGRRKKKKADGASGTRG